MRCNSTTFFFRLWINQPCFLEFLHVQPVLSKAKLKNLQSMFCMPNTLHVIQPPASKHWRYMIWYVILMCSKKLMASQLNLPPPQPFYSPFSGPPAWPGARRERLDFMVQGKINRGRNTDHRAGRHSIRTNQCPPAPSPIFTDWMPFLPPNQQCQRTEGN